MHVRISFPLHPNQFRGVSVSIEFRASPSESAQQSTNPGIHQSSPRSDLSRLRHDLSRLLSRLFRKKSPVKCGLSRRHGSGRGVSPLARSLTPALTHNLPPSPPSSPSTNPPTPSPSKAQSNQKPPPKCHGYPSLSRQVFPVWPLALLSDFGLRPSDFFRRSAFGFRSYPPPHQSAYPLIPPADPHHSARFRTYPRSSAAIRTYIFLHPEIQSEFVKFVSRPGAHQFRFH
jgi:hypothetical protein